MVFTLYIYSFFVPATVYAYSAGYKCSAIFTDKIATSNISYEKTQCTLLTIHCPVCYEAKLNVFY